MWSIFIYSASRVRDSYPVSDVGPPWGTICPTNLLRWHAGAGAAAVSFRMDAPKGEGTVLFEGDPVLEETGA